MTRFPHPVEARRARSGKLVRFAYGFAVLSLLSYVAWHFGRQYLFLEGMGLVEARRYVVSTPYVSEVQRINIAPGLRVTAGDLVARIESQEVQQRINDLNRMLLDQTQKGADLRIKLRVASATLEGARDRFVIASEAVKRFETHAADRASLSYRMDIYRERSLAQIEVARAEAEIAETTKQLEQLELIRASTQAKIEWTRADFDEGQIKAPVSGLVGAIAHSGAVIKPGDQILEIYDVSESYISWHVPAFSLREPKVADVVYVQYGSKVYPGYVWDIQQLARSTPEAGESIFRKSEPRQVILVKLQQNGVSLPIHAQVTVRMIYSGLTREVAKVALARPR